MKSFFKFAAVAFAASMMAVGCSKEEGGQPSGDVKVTGVELNKTTASVSVGGSVTLTATVTPADATNKKVSWSSDAEDVATVDGGVVTGVAAGEAEITVTTEDGGFTATCAITVTAGGKVDVTGVELDRNELKLLVGDDDVLVATVLPEDATDKEVIWTSDNNDIASVDQEGYVLANGAGVVNITVTTVDGSFTDVCSVTVTPKGTGGEFIELNADMISTNNEMQYISWDFTPQGEWGATTGYINWDIHHYSEQIMAEHGMDAPSWRRARYAQPQNMWDGDKATCFHTNFDIYETGGSWAIREGALVPDNYIQVELEEAVSKFNLYIMNPNERGVWLVGYGYPAPGATGTGIDVLVSDDGNEWYKVDGSPLDFPGCKAEGEGPNVEYTWENLFCPDLEEFYFIRIQPNRGVSSIGSMDPSGGTCGCFGIAELQLYKVEDAE